MKKGMTVIIYKDPVTRMKKEGTAKLMKKIYKKLAGNFIIECWKVRFRGDKNSSIRVIREDISREEI